MTRLFRNAFFLFCWINGLQCLAQNGFRIVPLGIKGGLDDGNLSAYMLAPAGSESYVCLDAGTVYAGIQKAVSKKAFKASADHILKKQIKGYLISHPHLDHVSGMVIASAEDTSKYVYGFPECIATLEAHYFNWQSWPNLGSAGHAPALKKYQYESLTENEEKPVVNTDMHVTAFRLSHAEPYQSAAFLLRNGSDYILYFGDTGPDEIEQKGKMKLVWQHIAPLVATGKMKGIFLEVSYPDRQPDKKLYGHLTPRWFMQEMESLARLTGRVQLKSLPVIITHIKPVDNNEQIIKKELAARNTLGLKLIFPEQGQAFELR